MDICRGITFFHGRCENILITENLKPKISNFKYSRALQANTTNIGNITNRSLTEIAATVSAQQAPKKNEGKKDDDYVPYTIQCEIFSFGMLLWELAFRKVPYRDMEISEIQKHVLSGKRIYLNFPISSYGVEEGYGNIIKAAWQSDPSLRPELSYLFNDLENLNRSLKGLNPKRSDMEVTPTDLRPDTPEIGYYYWEGYVVEKSLGKAVELFKEAADKGVPDAQLRYAFDLSDKIVHLNLI
ncbi:hypothetical protein RhiirB3_473961 [Rhizophagus irregularis]|nr:hypothetical protein RhiirB3_473961 [Rhizophagus irregularis]